MDISGVEIGPGVRLLVPEDGGQPMLFHRLEGDEWCATKVAKSNLLGSLGTGLLHTKMPLRCEHVVGRITDGQWAEIARL